MKMFNWTKYTGQRVPAGNYLLKFSDGEMAVVSYSHRIWNAYPTGFLIEFVNTEKLK